MDVSNMSFQGYKKKPFKPFFSYDTNLLNVLGKEIFRNIQGNFETKKPLLGDIVPEQDNVMKNIRFDLQFNPSSNYQLNLIKNRLGVQSTMPSLLETWQDKEFSDKTFRRGVAGTRGRTLPMPLYEPQDYEVHLTTPMPGQILKDIKKLFK